MSPTHRAEDASASRTAGAARADVLDELVDRMAAAQEAAPAPEPETVEEDHRDDRPDPPLLGDEAATLEGFLDFLRASVRDKCEGLSDEQAAQAPLGSLTSPIGLVRHLADVERHWSVEILGGVPDAEVGYRWMREEDPDAEFRVEAGASLAEALEDYAAACAASRAQMAGRAMDEEVRGMREARSVRWVVVHLVEETARHLGHLDAVRELIDGRTGE